MECHVRPDTPETDTDPLQPQDLSCKRPHHTDHHTYHHTDHHTNHETIIKTEDTDSGLFRPYCLKDPTEYKYERNPGLHTSLHHAPLQPDTLVTSPGVRGVTSFLQYRNIEDLATAQAILDLSSGSGHSTDHVTSPDLTQHDHEIKTETSDADTSNSNNTAVFKINGGRTTAYTYEVRN